MYLGLDFGTSGARACLIDAQHTVVWRHSFHYTDPQQQDTVTWKQALFTLLQQLPPAHSAQLQGIAINATSSTVFFCDETLEPVSPIMMYHDQRAASQLTPVKKICPALPATHAASSGLAKLLWLINENHHINAEHFVHQADWLSAQLTRDVPVSDYHNALKSGFDLNSLHWPESLTALPGHHLLPAVAAPGQPVATIDQHTAQRLNINKKCQIHAGTTDSNAAFIASGISDITTGLTSLGSTLVIKQLSKQPIDAPQHGIYSHKFDHLWLTGGASNAGAAVLRHFFDDEQLAVLSQQIDPETDSPCHYYPLLQPGERFPENNPQQQPCLTPRPENDADFLHGLLQSLTRLEQQGYQKLQQLGAPAVSQIITTGGGAISTTWRQMREHCMQIPVSTTPELDASLGSALLACRQRCLP